MKREGMNKARASLLNVPEVATMLGLSVGTVYVWISQQRLPVVKVGSRSMFDPADIDDWIEARKKYPPKE